MEKIQFDSGVKSYRINGSGILRFHPGDPNLYQRFLEAVERITALEQQWLQQTAGEESADGLLKQMKQADAQLKELLNWVFGEGNDFDKLLGGVNLLAMTDSGQRVISNLLQALEPVLVEGARMCTAQQTQQALDKARARREKQ